MSKLSTKFSIGDNLYVISQNKIYEYKVSKIVLNFKGSNIIHCLKECQAKEQIREEDCYSSIEAALKGLANSSKEESFVKKEYETKFSELDIVNFIQDNKVTEGVINDFEIVVEQGEGSSEKVETHYEVVFSRKEDNNAQFLQEKIYSGNLKFHFYSKNILLDNEMSLDKKDLRVEIVRGNKSTFRKIFRK